MRSAVIVLVCSMLLCGWFVQSESLTVAAQDAPQNYVALVASYRGGQAQGTGDITILRVTPGDIRILGSVVTTGSTVELAIAPNGQYAIALNQERLASVISDLDTSQPRESRVFPIGSGANAVAITPDSATAVILNGMENPPTVMIFDQLPDAPRLRGEPLQVPGAVLGTELDISMFDSGDSVAISTGCGGLTILDGIMTGPLTFRAGSPFTFTGCIQGLDLAPEDAGLYTASSLTGSGFSVLHITGIQPGDLPSVLETTPPQSSTMTNLRLSPDGSTVVAPGFQGTHLFRITEMGILPIRLVRIQNQLRAARQGGVAISPDSRVALVAGIDVQLQTRLSVISDLLSDDPGETAHMEPSPMVNTRPGAQQSIAFLPLLGPTSFFREEEPNDSIVQANLIVPDVIVLGTFGRNADVDYFSFDAKQNEVVTVETRAQRLDPPSSADTVLTLFDGNGMMLAENDDDGSTLDSRLEFTLPSSGRYVFRVSESRNKGGTNFNYEAVVTLRSN